MHQHSFKLEGQVEIMSVLPKVEYDLPSNSNSWSGLALVGEAPGADEVRLGHPFVGRSGQLLDKMLKKAEIDRHSCLVANVFRYQPAGNKIDHFFTSRRAANKGNLKVAEKFGQFGSAWCRADFAEEIEHLRATLVNLKPKIIVALGRTPMWALTGENGLLAKVGHELKGRLHPTAPVIATFHPSYILRGNWGLQDDWLRHFLAAKQYIN